MTPLRELLEQTYFPLNQRIRDEQTRWQYRCALNNLRDALGLDASESEDAARSAALAMPLRVEGPRDIIRVSDR